MLRFVMLLMFALSTALASPASALMDQYLEYVTKYHVDADSLDAPGLKAKLNAVLRARCGSDVTCPTTRVYEDLKSLTRALPDGSSSYLSPLELSQSVNAGRFTLGLELRGDVVYRVLPGSSAAAQGLRRGDRLLGVKREGVTVPLNALSFPDVKPVTLSLERGGTAQSITVLPGLGLTEGLAQPDSAMLDGGAAYLRLPSFRLPDTAQRLHSLISALQSRSPKGLVLDLRFNTGGYLDEALLSLGAFLEDGAVLGLQYRTASVTYSLRAGGVEAVQGAELKRIALEFAVKFRGRVVILVNSATSSAAEVFALAARRAGIEIIGETTAGRARYASLPLKLSDGSELRLAVTRNTYPNGDVLPQAVQPDAVIRDDVAALTRGADPVLEAALKSLQ